MICNFSMKHYEECLRLAKKKGYKFLRFDEYNKKKGKVIFLRHDIDFNIDNALKMAKIENRLKIKSTYFIRLCGNYNIFNINIYNKIKEIIDLKHEIGLHYEFNKKGDKSIFLNKFISTINFFYDYKIKSIAPHDPIRLNEFKTNKKMLKEINIDNFAYANKFIKDIKYISDSSCNWREGCMCKVFERNIKELCILTHPIWWFDKYPSEGF